MAADEILNQPSREDGTKERGKYPCPRSESKCHSAPRFLPYRDISCAAADIHEHRADHRRRFFAVREIPRVREALRHLLRLLGRAEPRRLVDESRD